MVVVVVDASSARFLVPGAVGRRISRRQRQQRQPNRLELGHEVGDLHLAHSQVNGQTVGWGMTAGEERGGVCSNTRQPGNMGSSWRAILARSERRQPEYPDRKWESVLRCRRRRTASDGSTRGGGIIKTVLDS